MVDKDYYSKKLSANLLKRCYDVATPRISQYLEAEVQYVLDHIEPEDVILELGCGYGRFLSRMTEKTSTIYGIDSSKDSIALAKDYLAEHSSIMLYQMNANSLTFEDNFFDVVIAVQNGISAFKIPPQELIKESLRVTKRGGKILLSSYSDKIWNARLEWFIRQSNEGLLGEIDFDKTKQGVIICKDGFEARTYTEKDFLALISKLNLNATVNEVDDSSIFCTIQK